TAMKHRRPILPLLVNRATMPEESQLPDTLCELHSYNAAKVDAGQDFRLHMRRLIDSISETLGAPEDQSLLSMPTPVPTPSQLRRFSIYGAAALTVAAGLAVLLWPGTASFERPMPSPSIGSAPQGIPASITDRKSTR